MLACAWGLFRKRFVILNLIQDLIAREKHLFVSLRINTVLLGDVTINSVLPFHQNHACLRHSNIYENYGYIAWSVVARSLLYHVDHWPNLFILHCFM